MISFFRLFQILIFIAVINTVNYAQKPFEPSNCYMMKSNFAAKSASATIDERGDFIDITKYIIDLDITDFVAKEFAGNTKIEFVALQSGISSIELDLLILDIDSIRFMNSTISTYTYNDTLIHIDFPSSLSSGNNYSLIVYYHGKPIQIPGDWGGFFWNNTYAYNVGVSFTEDIHNFGKAWFPCFDNFTERSKYEFIIKTQGVHKAFCNGTLQSETANIDGTKTWRWKLEQEIPTYLASVAVANYATIYDTYNGSSVIPIELAAKASDTTDLKNSFVHLKDAMSSFEERYGKYRFDRIGYCVTSFTAGAMEHATNITYMAAVVNGNTQYETLMAHELSHHWWGNNTTCQTAEDMWLNEGFASYSEAVFTESVYGEEAYKQYSRTNHDEVLRRTHLKDGEYLAVAGVPSQHTYSSTVYDKGADMIHTIRGILGDDLFFKTLKGFQEKNKFSDITTDDFNNYITDSTSLNLTSFFNTWIKEPGFRHYSISEIDAVATDDNFLITGSIKQKLWEATTFTDFLPIDITFYDENWDKTTKTVYIYGECSDFEFELDFEPVYTALDIDEKIQDATVDKYQIISNIGINDFGLARLELDVQNIVDSSLIRVVHHYIKPDPMVNKIANLHLSPNRYWSVQGIFSANFKTNAKFVYNGTINNNVGFLDNDLFTANEDSIVVLYRKNAQTDWTLVDSFDVNTQGSIFNKSGFITVFNLQKGDYVLAIYDEDKTQDNSTKSECIFTDISKVDRLEKLINVYPVPTKNYVNIDFLDRNMHIESVKIYNILGKEIESIQCTKTVSQYKIETAEYNKGAYILSFIRKGKNVFSKKIIVE